MTLGPAFPTLILASTSPTRRALLDSAGLRYQAQAPRYEEEIPPGVVPSVVALTLALGKARAVSSQEREALVLGADQVLELDGQVYGKPSDALAAKEMLRALSGRSHCLHTGVALLCAARQYEESFVETTWLSVRPLEEEEISAYVATGEWEGCAGGYRIEGRGACLFSQFDGDYFNILGLPLLRVISSLRTLGMPLFR